MIKNCKSLRDKMVAYILTNISSLKICQMTKVKKLKYRNAKDMFWNGVFILKVPLHSNKSPLKCLISTIGTCIGCFHIPLLEKEISVFHFSVIWNSNESCSSYIRCVTNTENQSLSNMQMWGKETGNFQCSRGSESWEDGRFVSRQLALESRRCCR